MAVHGLERLAVCSGHRQTKLDTIIAWHRRGFRLFWTWKVRSVRPGRPAVAKDVRELIRKLSRENPLWGAPRIHGELLKLGIDIGETSVGKYLVRHRKPPSHTWRTFLENHVKTMFSVDFFTVPAITFQRAARRLNSVVASRPILPCEQFYPVPLNPEKAAQPRAGVSMRIVGDRSGHPIFRESSSAR